MYLNDITSVLRHTKPHLYAADLQTYKESNSDTISLRNTVHFINSDVQAIQKWSRDNHVALNSLKTQVNIFGLADPSSLDTKITIEGVTIEPSSDVLNLGLIMSNSMSWMKHCNNIAAKVYSGLKSLWQHFYLTSRAIRLSLVKSLLIPHFTYCCPVFANNLDSHSKQTLQKAFKACTRYVYGLRRFDSTNEHRKHILGCEILDFLDYRSACFLHNLVLSRTPSYLHNKLSFSRSHRTLNMNVQMVGSRAHNSLLVRGVVRYNSLPIHVKRTSTISAFRSKCLDYFCCRP